LKEKEQKDREVSECKEEEIPKSQKKPGFGPPLFHRAMRCVDQQEVTEFDQPGSKFTVMSYNLLADKLFSERATHLLGEDPTNSLKYRDWRVLAELE
jgi:mRNA deadenylase 3'-5' endonuclease subunit Ccr4